MTYYVPDFELQDDQHLIPTSSSTFNHHKAEDEILELLWQDGQVVSQPQHQHRKFQSYTTDSFAHNQYNNNHPQSSQQQQQPQEQQLHMAEDEMATWLHYPIDDLYNDLITENQTTTTTTSVVRQSTVVRSPVPPPSTVALPQQPPLAISMAPPQNFQLFSRMRGKGPEATVVESNSTTAAAAVMSAGEASSVFPSGVGRDRILETGGGSGETAVSSSSGTSGSGRPTDTCTTAALATATLEGVGERMIKGEVEDRKRKQRQIDHSITTPTSTSYQDVELDAANDPKKRSRGLHSSKRTRAAEVHNLSERRRRDRINEKMKALQELVPRCNKSDKASMLDEVIEYLKSLQMQVQMMSMGSGMVPMMYPGMQQQFMPPIMGMGMGMGMNRPMIQLPPNIPGSNFPTSPAVGAAGPQISPNFNIQPVRMPSVPAAAANCLGSQGDSVRRPFPVQPPGLPQHPNMADPYQQYMALQQMQMMQMQMQMQMQAVQNQSVSYRGSSKTGTSYTEGQPGPSTSKSEGEDEH